MYADFAAGGIAGREPPLSHLRPPGVLTSRTIQRPCPTAREKCSYGLVAVVTDPDCQGQVSTKSTAEPDGEMRSGALGPGYLPTGR